MSKKLKQSVSALLSTLTLLPTTYVKAAPQVERPPQYVLMAFDGSRENTFWQASRDFAKQMNAMGKPLKFTYFISGVYWLMDTNKSMYQGPHHNRGRSDIGFGDDADKLSERIDQSNFANLEGHEIASHANGHFDGNDKSNPWTESDWSSEFQQFNDLVFNVFTNNRLKTTRNFPAGNTFSANDVQGFRAPLLAYNKGLWPALKKFGFKYDTSQTRLPNYWPQRDDYGLWQFPLAEIPIAGTARKTLSMDFNFYYVQSKGVNDMYKADPSVKERFKKQMYDSYMSYFNNNYVGNRAPIHIGHHFSQWNGGAYWEAMKDMAREVCGMPEVKCVTYKEYMNWLESKDAATLASYKAGNFPKMQGVRTKEVAFVASAPVSLTRQNDVFVAKFEGRGEKVLGYKAKIAINGQALNKATVSLKELREKYQGADSIVVSGIITNRAGEEINSKSYKLNHVGTAQESLDSVSLEERALKGDLPEAHQ